MRFIIERMIFQHIFEWMMLKWKYLWVTLVLLDIQQWLEFLSFPPSSIVRQIYSIISHFFSLAFQLVVFWCGSSDAYWTCSGDVTMKNMCDRATVQPFHKQPHQIVCASSVCRLNFYLFLTLIDDARYRSSVFKREKLKEKMRKRYRKCLKWWSMRRRKKIGKRNS